MSNLKTAFVVFLLLAVLYGVYTVLNQPEPRPPKDFAWANKESLEVELGTSDEAEASTEESSSEVITPSARLQGNDNTEQPSPSRWNTPATSPPSRARSKWELNPETPLPPNGVDRSPSNDGARWETIPDEQPAKQTSPNRTNDSFALPRKTDDVSDPNSIPDNSQTGFVPRSNRDDRFTSDTSEPSNVLRDPREDAQPTVQENPFFRKPQPEANGVAEKKPGHYVKPSTFEPTWQNAQTQIAAGQWREALLTLSQAYESPQCTTEERNKLLELLDPLAAKVVYSQEHLLEMPYVVRRGDTLVSLAEQLNVPVQLLQNINGISTPDVLLPGSKLKVLRGPFRAEVDLTTQELTLYVQRLYAGRFPVSVGRDPFPRAGEFEVRGKEVDRVYYAADGKSLPANHPSNPYGRYWIDLGGDVSIHGSASVDNNAALGCISLSPKDAEDVFGILSQGSRVVIRR